MSNAFDSANFPEREPTTLIAGDRWMWKITDLGADYPPASYALKYALRRESDGTEIEITAAESGADYIVEVAAATTGGYAAGRYRWQRYITRTSDSQRVTLGSGIVEVRVNRDTSDADPRSHARKCLDSIEAALEAFAADSVQSYQITTGAGSRSVTKRDTAELLLLRDRYRQEVDSEKAAENIAAGLGNPRHFGVRFNRV